MPLGWPSGYQAKAHQAFLDLSHEWQTFIQRRLQEDMRLFQQIAKARSPDQVWMAYAGFWQKAGEDYANEYAAIAKLVGDCVMSGITVVPEASPSAEEPVLPVAKAA